MEQGPSRRQSFRQRTSSLLASARASFVRSRRAPTGASVATLRGTAGADFEGHATVHRGGDAGLFDCGCLPSCGKKRDGLRFLLIKGSACFVFRDEEGQSPEYAIGLAGLKAVARPGHASLLPHVPHPGAGHDATYATVHLETALGDVEYQFTFVDDAKDDGLAAKFCTAVAAAAAAAATEMARERLGHGRLLSKRSSVRYAEGIAQDKAKAQPDKPVGAGEILAEMPSPYAAG